MRKIFFIVLGVHFAALIWMALSPTMKKENKKTLYVKTVLPKHPQMKMENQKPTLSVPPTPRPRAPTPQKVSQLPKESPSKPKVEGKPVKKNETFAPVKKVAPTAKAKSPPQKISTPVKPKKNVLPSSNIPADLLKELEESIAKIEQKQDKKLAKAQIQTPKQMGPLYVDKEEWEVSAADRGSADYEEQLIQSLHETLHLPEYGMVKMKLTLKNDGAVLRLIVIEAESQKNKSYLEKQIRNVKFPHFNGSFFAKKQEYTFILTFCNEI